MAQTFYFASKNDNYDRVATGQAKSVFLENVKKVSLSQVFCGQNGQKSDFLGQNGKKSFFWVEITKCQILSVQIYKIP